MVTEKLMGFLARRLAKAGLCSELFYLPINLPYYRRTRSRSRSSKSKIRWLTSRSFSPTSEPISRAIFAPKWLIFWKSDPLCFY